MRLVSLILSLLLSCPAFAADELLGQPVAPSTSLLDGSSRFLPVDQAYPLVVDVHDETLRFVWQIMPGYYLYRARMGLRLVEGGNARALELELPPGEPHEDEFFGVTEIYRGGLALTVPLAESSPHTLELKSQGCADAGLCYPPRTQRFLVDPSAGTISELAPAPRVAATTLPATSPPEPVAAPPASLAFMILLAMLGGLILNLMPCVFPVLSLKILSIARKGGQVGASERLAHGLAYSGGVVLSFVLVAALLLALRAAGEAIGWGFHLQSPVFVGGLAYLFLAMGLGLSGLANFGAGLMGAGDALAHRGGYTGSFFTGVLATVVASPCSAPFMGTALGYALTQSALPALTVFAALGVGMAAPFLLLATSPRLLNRLPHPGPWMDGFKQFLAFPLYAAAVWLLWVLGKQTGVDGMAAVLGGALLLALGLWTWERALRHRHPLAFRAAGAALLALAIGVLGSPLLSARAETGLSAGTGWERYSPQRLDELRAEGRPVFLNVTADWCITCLANEKIALDTDTVRAAFRATGVTLLKGDWTNSDPELTRLLIRHGRSGVPLYLYFPPGRQAAPAVLPQLLTPAIVRTALGMN